MSKKEVNNYIYFVLPILAISLALFALNVSKMSSVLFFPHSTDYAEAIAFFTPISNLYKSFNTYPYVLTYYPPLYYVVLDTLRPLFSTLSPYVYERILNLIAAIIDLPLLYILCRKSLKQSMFSSLLAVFMLAGAFVFMINALDLPLFELIFDLAALIVIFSKLRWAPVFSALLLTVAFFFRQSALLIAPGIFLYLFLSGKRKDAIIFTIVFLVAAGIPTLLLNIATQGRFVFSVYILPFITQFMTSQLQGFLNTFLLTTPFLILLVLFLYSAYDGKRSPLFWVVLFSLISIVSSGKWGGSYVYFLVPFALICAAAAPSIELFFTQEIGSRLGRPISYVIFLLVFFGFLIPALYSANTSLNFSPQAESPITGNMLSSFSGNILVETPSLALDANKSMEFEPSIFWVMQQKGEWNDSAILSDVNSQNFSAIVFPKGFGRFSKYNGLENAINDSYKKDYAVGTWEVYVPKNSIKT